MDIEKTMEFILEQQAKTEALWQRNEERWQRAEARMDGFDKSLIGVRKLLMQGAKILVTTQKELRELAAAQKRTDQRFDRLIEILKGRSPNGRH